MQGVVVVIVHVDCSNQKVEKLNILQNENAGIKIECEKNPSSPPFDYENSDSEINVFIFFFNSDFYLKNQIFLLKSKNLESQCTEDRYW